MAKVSPSPAWQSLRVAQHTDCRDLEGEGHAFLLQAKPKAERRRCSWLQSGRRREASYRTVHVEPNLSDAHLLSIHHCCYIEQAVR